MAHTKVYAICENKCHVQTNAGYASLAAINPMWDPSTTHIETIFAAMENNTSLVYGVYSTNLNDGIFPMVVTNPTSPARQAIVRIDKAVGTASVMFKYKEQLWTCDAYNHLSDHGQVASWVSRWVRVV